MGAGRGGRAVQDHGTGIGAVGYAPAQTLLAHTPDGFDTVKIAMIQNRDEKEVIADLESAREALR